MNKRIAELDMVKGIGIVYVFFRHLCELTGVHVYGEGVYSIFNSCTECFMFLFVFLSGYVFKSKGSISLDIKNKFKQLIIPYLLYTSFFSCTYFIHYVLLGNMSVSAFATRTLSNFLANPSFDFVQWSLYTNEMKYAFVPYWYIAEVFTAFVVFIIVYNWFVEKKAYSKRSAVTALFALTSLLMYLDLRGIVANTFGSGVSYFTVGPNIVGFAALLFIGNILHDLKAFDIDAYPKSRTLFIFVVCALITVVQLALYNNQYALQYAKWGQSGIMSVRITTIAAFALTYSLIYLCFYLKQIDFVKNGLAYLGANTLDILLLHFGIAELICMVFGFWYPVYDIEKYPQEGFAWWHFYIVVALTALLIAIYLGSKKALRRT